MKQILNSKNETFTTSSCPHPISQRVPSYLWGLTFTTLVVLCQSHHISDLIEGKSNGDPGGSRHHPRRLIGIFLLFLMPGFPKRRFWFRIWLRRRLVLHQVNSGDRHWAGGNWDVLCQHRVLCEEHKDVINEMLQVLLQNNLFVVKRKEETYFYPRSDLTATVSERRWVMWPERPFRGLWRFLQHLNRKFARWKRKLERKWAWYCQILKLFTPEITI